MYPRKSKVCNVEMQVQGRALLVNSGRLLGVVSHGAVFCPLETDGPLITPVVLHLKETLILFKNLCCLVLLTVSS